MKHDLRSFKGCVPRADMEVLPLDVPKLAVAYKVDGGVLEPYRQPGEVGISLSKPGVIKSMYLFNHSTGVKWLHWREMVSVALSPLRSSDNNNVFFTDGVDGLHETGPGLVTDGNNPEQNTEYPVNSKKIYVPQPVSTISATGGDASGLIRDYTYTFSAGLVEDNGVITDFGYESAPAPASQDIYYDDQLDGDENHAPVELVLPTSAPNGAVVSHINIYRLAETGDYQLIKTLPIGIENYTDDFSDKPGRVLDTFDLIPPPDGIANLILLENGCFAATFEKEVLVTPPFVVYAWPNKYRFKCESNIVGHVATRSGILVATETVPYSLSGYDPDNMVPVRLDLNEPCKSSRSLVDMGEYALYAGANGLVLVSIGSAKLITSTLLNKQQWRSLNPASMFACEYEGKYLAFFEPDPAGEFRDFDGFIFDPRTNELFFHLFKATACHRDASTGDVYICGVDNKVFKIDSADHFATAGLQTGEQENFYRQFSFFKFDGDGDAYIKLVADGNVVRKGVFEPGKIYRLPQNRGRLWRYQIKTSNPFRRLVVATNYKELL